jgi:predicted HicB family RNase H-like nuclease
VLHPDATNWNAPDPFLVDPAQIEMDPVLTALHPQSPIEGAEVVFAPGQDNIEAAMHEVAEGLDLTVSTKVSDDDGPADKQILIRATEHDRERWKRAAQVAEVSLSALIRETMNRKVADILDCSHPMEFRVSYPWAEHCKKCGSRLRG